MIVAALLTLAFVYAAWIGYVFLSWRSIKTTSLAQAPAFRGGVSIVIAFRNEESHLPALLQALSRQNFPTAPLEIVLINDHSTDRSVSAIESFTSFPFALKVVHLPDAVTGKKQAIRYGVAQSSYEWILTTDADCDMGEEWVSSLITHAQVSKAKFVFGPVAYRKSGSFLLDFQCMELFSLIGSGAALWNKGLPTMCNGANLLYHKSLLEGEDMYAGNTHLASGDDEFLMHQVYARNPSWVSFVKNREALVHTEPCASWYVFYHQRKRWASKWGAYQMRHVKIIALGVFLLNVCFCLLPFSLCFNPYLMPWIIGIYAWRWFWDGIFIREITGFYNKPFNLVRYVEIALIYPWYVVISALAGRTKNYTWKGRTVS